MNKKPKAYNRSEFCCSVVAALHWSLHMVLEFPYYHLNCEALSVQMPCNVNQLHPYSGNLNLTLFSKLPDLLIEDTIIYA